MAIQQQTSAQYFKSLNLLHYILAAGQLLFAILTFMLQKKTWVTTDAALNAFRYAVSLIAILGISASAIQYKRQVNGIRIKKNLSDKLNAYRSVIITRGAFLEFPSLFSVIAFLITGEILFLVLAGSLTALFVFLRPTKARVIKDLQLSLNEIKLINNDDSIVLEVEADDD
jgi:hypothetical protein